MNAKQFWKLNPNFKFNRIFLYNQAKFNNLGTMKKFLFPLKKAYSNNKYMTIFKEDKNLDYLTQNLISEYKKDYNKETNPSIFSQSQNRRIRNIQAKMVNNNNLLKQIDFNINNNSSDEKNNSLELNINSYDALSQGNKKSKKIINLTESNNNEKINEVMKSRNYNNKYKMSKSFDGMKKEKENIKLPYVSTNINRRRYNILLFNKKNENIETDNNAINKKDEIKKEKQRDIFKNVNYFLDNKKTKLKVNDIERIILDIKNINNLEKEIDNEYFESKIFINTKIPKSEEKIQLKKKDRNIDEINDNNLLIDEETLRRKEKEKYMLYEKNKKFIEKKKIYNPMKYGQASIPNLSLDKGFRDVKKFEQTVINVKNSQIDLPFFNKNETNNLK